MRKLSDFSFRKRLSKQSGLPIVYDHSNVVYVEVSENSYHG